MNLPMPTPPAAALSLLDPFGFGRAAGRYWLDAFERSVLYLDVMRVRGNQYLEHIEQTRPRSEEHTSELQSRPHLVCRLLLEKKKIKLAHLPLSTHSDLHITPTEI